MKELTLSNGERIAYHLKGQGEKTVVLIHGNMSSSTNWLKIIEGLRSHCRVLAMDLRGFGSSSYFRPVYYLDELAKDVAELIRTLNLSRLTLVGWSTGGGVAMELCRRLSLRTERLVLLNSIGRDGFQPFPVTDFTIPPFSLSFWRDRCIEAQICMPLESTIREIYTHMIFRSIPDDRDFFEQILRDASKQVNMADIYHSIQRFHFADELTLPVHIWHGRKDRVIPYVQSLALLDTFPNARLKTFEQSGHAVMQDERQAFLDALLAIL